MRNILLKHDAQVTLVDNDGWPPVLGAARRGHKNSVNILLEHGAQISDDMYETLCLSPGFSATRKQELLLVATNVGDTFLAKCLLRDSSIDINWLDDGGLNAFNHAAVKEHLDMCLDLFDHAGCCLE